MQDRRGFRRRVVDGPADEPVASEMTVEADVARTVDVADLVGRGREGSPRAVARLISLVEDAGPQLREATAALTPHAGSAAVVGITGSPGVGKSTTTSALVTELRSSGRRVAVLAVDPSSPFTGGALLGDRIRMGDHALDSGVFIRSMASRGHLGGLAAATPQAVRVLDACGFDIVIIETVGVGQSEVEIVGAADTTVVLLAPGMGDGIQAAKAGILEIGDVFGVNKADRDGADATMRDLRGMLSLGERREPGQWRPPVVKLVAAQGKGVDDLAAALDQHHSWLAASGELGRRRRARVAAEIETLVLARLRQRLSHARSRDGDRLLDHLAEQVLAGATDPFDAADRLAVETQG
ncbi:MAG: methylmalonyl Co-A mutase-associated GTPase MeaB [Actinomycetales bacterium]